MFGDRVLQILARGDVGLHQRLSALQGQPLALLVRAGLLQVGHRGRELRRIESKQRIAGTHPIARLETFSRVTRPAIGAMMRAVEFSL